VKHQRTITYWEFSIDIIGPRYSTKRQRRAIHQVLSRKRLRAIEHAALLATKAKLPPRFKATVS
jgi:flagellar biosynthesis chaperone FliJ